MKHTFRKALSLALALLLTLTLVPSAARAEDDESAYSDASVEDIRVKASAADGHIVFSEQDDVEWLEYRDSSNVFSRKATLSVEDALADVCTRYFEKFKDDSHDEYTFDYISYVSLSALQGTIYNGYNDEGDTGSGVAGVLKYYYRKSASPSNAHIGDIRFVPKASFSGDALITYYGYYYYMEKDGVTNDWSRKTGSYAGRLYISVGKQEPGISYATDGEPARFAAEDFSTYSLATNGRTFRYITFTLPEASKGALYYNYVDASIYDYAVESGARFYRSSTPSVSNVYFVPKKGYSGTFLLPFSGIDSAGKEVSGNINITVTTYGPEYADTGGGPLTYDVEPGNSVSLEKDPNPFAKLCADELGSDYTFSQLRFMDLPSSSEGVLYSGTGTTLVRVNENYSKSSVPNIRFEANYNFTGKVSVPVRVYAARDGSTRFADAELIFNVEAGSAATPLHYTVDPGKRVFFENSDFVAAARNGMNGYTLNRIRFSELPAYSSGELEYMRTNNNVVSVSTGTDYSAGNLSSLSFRASDSFAGSVTIPFVGYSYSSSSSSRNGKSFSGTVTITSTKEAADTKTDEIGSNAKTLVYYTSGPAVALSRSDILNVASSSLSGSPSEIYLNRPEDTEGSLCRDFVSLSRHEEFDSRRSYDLSEIDHISFLPKAGFAGTSRMTYTVHDPKGNSFTGNIEFVVTPPSRSKYFNDMSETTWAIPAVDFFRYYGATNGTSATSFAPDTEMRRADFILLLSRAFSFPGVEGGSFADVSDDKYYAAAIASAKELGIISGRTEDAFRPEDPITREDAGVYLYRALRGAGAINPGSSEFLAQFPDASDTTAYAVEAMDALVREGVFQGYVRKLLPKRTLSRAETITILYRALT